MSDQYSPCPLRGSRDNISEYHSREVYLCEAKAQERRPALWQATMGGMPRRVIWGDLSTDQHVRVTRLIHDHPRYFAGGPPPFLHASGHRYLQSDTGASLVFLAHYSRRTSSVHKPNERAGDANLHPLCRRGKQVIDSGRENLTMSIRME